MTTIARRSLDRELLWVAINQLGRSGRHQVIVNQRRMAARLEWSRSTVWRAMGDLEVDGRLWRWKPKGRRGVLVLLSSDVAPGHNGKYTPIRMPTTGPRSPLKNNGYSPSGD